MTDIAKVVQHYHPEWQPPSDNRSMWLPVICPFHDESTPSASVSYEFNAFRCHGCGLKGDTVTLIMRLEEIDYDAAAARAVDIIGDSSSPVQRKPKRKSGRRVFGQSRPGPSDGVKAVRPRFRG